MAEHIDGSSRQLREGSDRAIAIVRSQVLRARSLARRAVERPAIETPVDVEARIRHLETALEEAYERIEVLEVLAREAVDAVDHQGALLDGLIGSGEARRRGAQSGPSTRERGSPAT
jgi:hypothetical protein